MEFSSVFNGAEQKPEIGPEKPEQNDADRMVCLFSCKCTAFYCGHPPPRVKCGVEDRQECPMVQSSLCCPTNQCYSAHDKYLI